MRGFQRGYDTLQSRQFECGSDSFVIGGAQELRPATVMQMRMQRTDTRVIQTCRDAVRFHHLAVRGLHYIAAAAMQDTGFTELRGSSAHPAVKPMSCGLDGDQFDASLVQEMIECPGRVAATADTGDGMRRKLATRFFLQLSAYLFADDALKTRYHVRVGMRAYYAADDIVGVQRMIDPIADGLIGCILERLAAAGGGYHLRSQHLHPGHVRRLAFDIFFSHIDDALHAFQRTHSGSGYAVLSRTRFGNDPLFSQPARQQYLPHRIIDLVRPGMIQVLAFQEQLCIVFGAHPRGKIQRRRSADIVLQQRTIFFLKRSLMNDLQVARTQFLYIGIEHLRYKGPSVPAVITPFVGSTDRRHNIFIYSVIAFLQASSLFFLGP